MRGSDDEEENHGEKKDVRSKVEGRRRWEEGELTNRRRERTRQKTKERIEENGE